MRLFRSVFRAFFCRVSFGVHRGLGLLCCVSGKELFAQSSQRFTLALAEDEANYTVDVWLPRGYLADPRPYPMLLMLDGDYAFSSAVQISEYLQRSREIEEFIIVGLSYDVGFGKPLAVQRTRDFTPPVDQDGAIKKTDTAYYRFIKDRLLPELHTRYQIDPMKRALWGYSLSGSFTAWLNYYDPSLFDHYILASGNLMDFGIVQRLFQGQIFSGKTFGDRRVFISYDATEIPDPKIVEDGRKLLSNKEVFSGYEIRLFLTTGESHTSSWFVCLPTSLRFVFGYGGDKDASKQVDSTGVGSASPGGPDLPVIARKE